MELRGTRASCLPRLMCRRCLAATCCRRPCATWGTRSARCTNFGTRRRWRLLPAACCLPAAARGEALPGSAAQIAGLHCEQAALQPAAAAAAASTRRTPNTRPPPPPQPAPAQVRFSLTYPEIYEVGASNLGHIILYTVLNRAQGLLCDRAYFPGVFPGPCLQLLWAQRRPGPAARCAAARPACPAPRSPSHDPLPPPHPRLPPPRSLGPGGAAGQAQQAALCGGEQAAAGGL
jgi:hypothetical protein